MADACVYFLNKKVNHYLINIGSDIEMSIKSYAHVIKKLLNYEGKIVFDKTKPDGTYRKKQDLSISKKYGWKAKTTLVDGLKLSIDDFKKNIFKN